MGSDQNRRLSDYAKINPPLRQLVAACAVALGVKLPDHRTEKPKYLTIDEVRALVERTGGRIPGVGSM